MIKYLNKKLFNFKTNFFFLVKYYDYNLKINVYQFTNISSTKLKKLNLNKINKYIYALKENSYNNVIKNKSNTNLKNFVNAQEQKNN